MSGTEGPTQTDDPTVLRKVIPTAPSPSAQQSAQRSSTAATDYWQTVAAAGRQARADAKPQAQGEKPARQRGLRS
jgi:hypothetical protein